MRNAENTLAEAIRARLKSLETNTFAAEKSAGLPEDAIRSVLKGQRKAGTSINRVLQICDALGLELYIGPPRQSDDTPAVDPHENPDYALVPAYPVEASAGDGATAVDVAPDGALAFRKDWLSKHGISLDNATLLRARGDSMEPIIWDGDLLLIDRSRTTIPVATKKSRQKSVYVVELEGHLLVKTLRRPAEDRILVLSENVADYDAFELRGRELNSLRIVGKVVWWGHTAG